MSFSIFEMSFCLFERRFGQFLEKFELFFQYSLANLRKFLSFGCFQGLFVTFRQIGAKLSKKVGFFWFRKMSFAPGEMSFAPGEMSFGPFG